MTGQASVLEGVIPSLERLDCLLASSDAARASSLGRLLPELRELEHALAGDRARQEASLRTLESDERLKRLATLAAQQRSEFDAFDLIGRFRFGSGGDLWGWEEFHSNTLAWLLDPKESHGFVDRFLKRFLLRAGVPQAASGVDWSATEVTREWPNEVDGQWGFLDLLIVNKAAQVFCAIENKTFSEEHDEQLTRYRQALEVSYSTFTKCYVFLTPWGTDPFREKERKHWKPFTYAIVYDIVQQIAENDKSSTNADARAFLRQYATTLRRNLMSDTNISELSRRIWLEHREAIELLLANRPNWVDETTPILEAAIDQQPGWIPDSSRSGRVRFRSADWDQYETSRTGTEWLPGSSALFLCEFTFGTSGRPYFRIALGSGNGSHDRLRERLFAAATRHPQLFRLKASTLSESWMALHEDKDYMLDKADYGIGWGDGTTRAKLEKWVEDFATTRFAAMNKVIVDCLSEYEAERKAAESD